MAGHHGPAPLSIRIPPGTQGISNAGFTPAGVLLTSSFSDSSLGFLGVSFILADAAGWIFVRTKDVGTSTRVTGASAGTLIFTGEVFFDRITITQTPVGINSTLTIRDGINGAAPIVWVVSGADLLSGKTLEFHRKLTTGLFYEMAGTTIGEWILLYRRVGFD
jgi:hypothetical protein